MFARTAITVTACANFVVEGAVDFISFSAEDAGEVVGHVLCLLEVLVRRGLEVCGTGAVGEKLGDVYISRWSNRVRDCNFELLAMVKGLLLYVFV